MLLFIVWTLSSSHGQSMIIILYFQLFSVRDGQTDDVSEAPNPLYV